MPNTPHANNFNLLRLLAAVAVLYSHGVFLYGKGLPVPFAGHSLGATGVYVFFFVSGYLIAQSWSRSPDACDFAARRVARIYPGLLASALLATLLIGPLMTRLPLAAYWAEAGTWIHLLNNALGLATVQVLPGVFETLPFARAVNGSLWTIRYELLMYALLAVLGAFGLRRTRHAYLICSLVLAAIWLVLPLVPEGHSVLAKAVPGWFGELWTLPHTSSLGVFFFIGSAFAQYQATSRAWMGGLGLLTLVLASQIAHPLAIQVLLWLGIPCLTFFLAHLGTAHLQGRPHTDVSYGMYIYAFPVQQALTQVCLARDWSVVVCLGLSLLITTVLATLSWFWLEKPAMEKMRAVLRKRQTRRAQARPSGTQGA